MKSIYLVVVIYALDFDRAEAMGVVSANQAN